MNDDTTDRTKQADEQHPVLDDVLGDADVFGDSPRVRGGSVPANFDTLSE